MNYLYNVTTGQIKTTKQVQGISPTRKPGSDWVLIQLTQGQLDRFLESGIVHF